jgi:hypothetical protein
MFSLFVYAYPVGLSFPCIVVYLRPFVHYSLHWVTICLVRKNFYKKAVE